MSAHPLLAAFHAHTPALGAWLTLPGASSARTAALASPHLAWLLVDCEHGMVPLQPGAGELVQALHGLPRAPSVLVRIPATGAHAEGSAQWQIKYALDAGARGVLVPMVENGRQAAALVAAARFPPRGIRGFGSPFTHHAWGLDAQTYLRTANESIVVLVQIETVEGVRNLDEMLAVDGLDGVFIGPYDLSISHGYEPPSPDPVPEVEEIIQSIKTKAHAAGKKCAFFCTTGQSAARRAKEGFDMINVTSDTGALTEGLKNALAIAAGEVAGERGFGY